MIIDKANAALESVYTADTPEALAQGLCRMGRDL